jgi:hypothetical protein
MSEEGIKKHESYEERESRLEREGFVNFGVVALDILHQQSQYASRYVDGAIPGYPNLGEGLRFDGYAYDYHSLAIHKDDVGEFARRVNEYKKSRSFG